MDLATTKIGRGLDQLVEVAGSEYVTRNCDCTVWRGVVDALRDGGSFLWRKVRSLERCPLMDRTSIYIAYHNSCTLVGKKSCALTANALA